MSLQLQTISFDLTCDEPRAWLVLQNEHGQASVLEMCRRFPDQWNAEAELTPGEYLCRYYGGDDRRVIYYGAASIKGSVAHGMDSLISVGRPRDGMASDSRRS